MHDFEALHSLCLLLTASGNLAVSWASLIFQKRFPDFTKLPLPNFILLSDTNGKYSTENDTSKEQHIET